MKITEYPTQTSITAENILLLDGGSGTATMPVTDAILSALNLISPYNNRLIFRGKNLGTSVTSEQTVNIQNGTFTDLWLGDYWQINGINWRIADFDYFYNCGDTAFTSHHLVIVPDTLLGTVSMNDTATTLGAYVGSQMYTTHLPAVKSTIVNAFGASVLTHREYLTTTVTGDMATAGEWYDSTVELMNEPMVFGSYIHTQSGVDSKRYTLAKTQLALFAASPRLINIGASYWLRDVTTSAQFAYADYRGSAGTSNASLEYGIRPYFVIG